MMDEVCGAAHHHTHSCQTFRLTLHFCSSLDFINKFQGQHAKHQAFIAICEHKAATTKAYLATSDLVSNIHYHSDIGLFLRTSVRRRSSRAINISDIHTAIYEELFLIVHTSGKADKL